MEANTAIQRLDGEWKLQGYEPGKAPPEARMATLDDRFWMSAHVPGDVHTTLIRHRLIEHPYVGHHDQGSRWIEDREWWYRTQFDFTPGEAEDERCALVFEGLDTFATVYVNGLEVGRAANMLMAHSFDVTRTLRPGWNAIAVRFDPVRLHHEDKQQFQWSSYTKERPWLRKAAMNFGWDWGPRMVTCGVWGGVYLRRSAGARLTSVFGRTRALGRAADDAAHDRTASAQIGAPGPARLRVDAEIDVFRQGGWSGGRSADAYTCAFRLRDADGVLVAEAMASVGGGAATGFGAGAELTVAAPRLWWTHDLGEPYLYTLETELRRSGKPVDVARTPLGIRLIELQTRHAGGEPDFAFVLNGVRIYAKGANWIPADHFIGAIPDQRYQDLVELAVQGNMNMLRIWGGGIYEKDVFYDACDRRGVLVWQDFAFANAQFPDFNREFMDNVRQEAESNVRRLRNHPSLALWCGNNEIDWLIDMKTAGGDLTTPFYGERIYHELLPDVLDALDDSRAYWPSSPFGGSDANDPDVGDRHNWQVWHGSVYPRRSGEPPRLDYSVEGVSFKNYKKDFALFSSEFGMHASANRYTLEKYIPEGEFYWNSAEMAYRNKDTNHRKGLLLMEGYTGVPQDIEQYMNYSMLTQAEGLKYGIEHYRRIKARNGGALVWQFNDSWPGTSWAMIDYELLPKASYYYGKGFFHPVLLSLDHEPGEPLRLWVVNDTLAPLTGRLVLRVRDFAGALLHESAYGVDVEASGADEIGLLAEADALGGAAAESVLVELSAEGFEVPANRYYLRDPKDLALPQTTLRTVVDGAAGKVTITAEGALARFVKLDVPQGNLRFSDNFFDLLPGESRTVAVTDRDGATAPLGGLRVQALNGEVAERE
ncbi:glycoside hydrolase family 2 protein [Paenibacillus sp. IB182496]|uniref:Beta-mannosidase B n=1 Tax=Paenibacillus sabuli TaxID=2772509 RepID=A0A927GTZ1_9BACL|nr:glycoside hydrolase family 2 protein [Paenibacillus sabuli]MBD2848369.1 glycoside hydrolase family 2 protein [Paenibacillus sabuli]